jgi:hypothetical protein
VPAGGTTLASGDTLLVLAEAETFERVRARVAEKVITSR